MLPTRGLVAAILGRARCRPLWGTIPSILSPILHATHCHISALYPFYMQEAYCIQASTVLPSFLLKSSMSCRWAAWQYITGAFTTSTSAQAPACGATGTVQVLQLHKRMMGQCREDSPEEQLEEVGPCPAAARRAA